MFVISAMSHDGVIGAGDGMPWDVPEEYEHFLRSVDGATIVFGRKSYEIFGGDLPEDRMVVVTSRPKLDGVRVAGSFEEAIETARRDDRPIAVAGGATVYEAAIPVADRLCLSTIYGDFEGDTRFPEFDRSAWRVTRYERHARYEFREWTPVGRPSEPGRSE